MLAPAKASSWPLRLAIVGLTVSLFGGDHATKNAADVSLPHDNRAVNVVRGVLELRYTENHDTAFSLLQNFGLPRVPGLLLAASLLALAGVVVAWVVAARKRATREQHVGFALVLAGA